MKTVIIPAVVLLVGLIQAGQVGLQSGERGKELMALERKVVGVWKGQTPCTGTYHFRADGTYELKGHGPGLDDSAGTWMVRWDALPATLILTCTSSEIPEVVGKSTETRLIRLDDGSLAVKHANHWVERFERVKK